MAKQTETSTVEGQPGVATVAAATATPETNRNAAEASSLPDIDSLSEAALRRNYRAIARVQGALVVDNGSYLLLPMAHGFRCSASDPIGSRLS